MDISNIETVEIGTLVSDPANVRKHGERNLEAIKGSLARFGQQKPIVVGEDNVVIAGNGTLEAARALNWTHIKIVRSRLAGVDRTAFAIADNRTAELAEWDDTALASMLATIQTADEELAKATGFDAQEIEKLASSVTLAGQSPGEFAQVDETIHTDYACPKCGYKWSGGIGAA